MKLKIGDYIKYTYCEGYFLIMRVEKISKDNRINLFVVYDSDTNLSLKGRFFERWDITHHPSSNFEILTPGEVFVEVL